MKKLCYRQIHIYDLPISSDVIIAKPETVILRFPHGKTIDIGSLCFFIREPSKREISRKKSNVGRMVSPESFNALRTTKVAKLIRFISEELEFSGLRVETIRDHWSRFLAFMAWSDAHAGADALLDEVSAKHAATGYVEFMRERVRKHSISLKSGSRQLINPLKALERFHEIDDILKGLPVFRAPHNPSLSTLPTTESDQARVLELTQRLWNGLTSLVLDGNPYPHAIEMPTNLKLPGNTLWIFPLSMWFSLPNSRESATGYEDKYIGYNYLEGRLNSVAEITERCSSKYLNLPEKIARLSARQIANSNTNLRCKARLAAANQAKNMFIFHFLAQTGMNWAQLANLPWSDTYIETVTRQGFRCIKWRAGGKEVSFELPISFMSQFKRYLELRKYILNGQVFDYLFLSIPCGGNRSPKILSSGLNSFYVTLIRIDPDLPQITPRQWRANKSDWLVRNVDIGTAAAVLQDTERTILRHYIGGSETTQMAEISSFLESVSIAALKSGVRANSSVSRAVGTCQKFGAPASVAPESSSAPDCHLPEGCLFCQHLNVSKDEEDVQKLFSCRYVLQKISTTATSEEVRQTTYIPTLSRIDAIIQKISESDKNMVQRIEAQVYEEGELTNYWASKFQMLQELGILS